MEGYKLAVIAKVVKGEVPGNRRPTQGDQSRSAKISWR